MPPCSLAVAFLLAASPSVRARPVAPLDPDVLHRVKRATALVVAREVRGSAFVVGEQDGRTFLVTNAHVVAPLQGKQAAAVRVYFDVGLREAPPFPSEAAVHARDAGRDLALLSVPTPTPRPGGDAGPRALALARTCDAAGGQEVYAAGFPFGGAPIDGAGASATLSPGRLSVRGEVPSLLEVDVGINPGNSGGAVVDARGTVVGVAVAHVRRTDRSFAVPCADVRAFLVRAAPALAVRAADVAAPRPLAAALPGAPTAEDGGRFVAQLGTRATGVVVARRGDELLVVTADAEPFAFRAGTDDDRVDVRLRGDAAPRAGRVVKVDRLLALVKVRAPGWPAPGFVLAPRDPKQTEHVTVIGFVPTSLQGSFELQAEDGNVAAVRGPVVQLDFGTEGGLLGGPVFDDEGKLIALAMRRRPGTNVSVGVPTEDVFLLMEDECVPSEAVAAERRKQAPPGSDAEYMQVRGHLTKVNRSPGDLARAAALAAPLCKAGHAMSCDELGMMHLFGVGAEEDREKARRYLRRACALGTAGSCKTLWVKFGECEG